MTHRAFACLLVLVLVPLPAVADPARSACDVGLDLGGCAGPAWRYRHAETSYDRPAAGALSHDGRTLFVSGLALGEQPPYGVTLALDARSGARRWVAAHDGNGDGIVRTTSTSVLVASSLGAYPGDAARVDAFDASSGALAWSVTTPPGAALADLSAASLAADGARLFVLARNGAVVSVDVVGGELEWISPPLFDRGANAFAQTLVTNPDGSRVHLVGAYHDPEGSDASTSYCCDWDLVVLTLDAATGAQLWRLDAESGGYAQPAYTQRAIAVSPDGGRVYVTGVGGLAASTAGMSANAFVAGYDARSGEEQWVADLDGGLLHGAVTSVGVVAVPDGTQVLVGGNVGGSGTSVPTLWSIDPSTGARRWRSAYDGAPALYASEIELRSSAGRVFMSAMSEGAAHAIAFDARDGATLWSARQITGSYPEFLDALVVSEGGNRIFLLTSASELPFSGSDLVVTAYNG